MNLDLYTERLHIRPLTMDDVDLSVELFTDKDITQYAGGVKSVDDIKADMPKFVARAGLGCIGVWCILDKKTDEKLGSIALVPMPIDTDFVDWSALKEDDIPKSDIEIGYFFTKPAWGKGYATEAAKRILQFAFVDSPLTEIVATFDDPNVSSRHVLLKSGFRDRGRRYCYAEDNCPDFRITRKEWLQDQA